MRKNMRLRILVTAALLISIPMAAADRPAGIAFHYASPLTPAELEWFASFEVLVTHDPLPRAQVDALHERGTKLALYEWSVAFYDSLKTSWQARIPPAALLNDRPLRGHLGASDADAWYYDPAAPGHAVERAEALSERLRGIGYDGVFFDTTTSASVHPDALAEYLRRHPDRSWDEAFADFLATLREELRGGLIVTNQGYRAAAHVLPWVDWDVTESLITYPVEGKFVLRPWDDLDDPWNSTAFLVRTLIDPVRKEFPSVRYAHINYVEAPDRKRIAEIVAITLLLDARPVVAVRDVSTMIESDLLLLDIGEPKPLQGTHRFYTRGFVAWNPEKKPLKVPNADEYVDAVTGARVRGTIVVPPGSARILRRVP
jgi:hypothetical protein